MKKQKNLAGLQKRKAISGYLFIMPFIIGFLAFMVKPFFQSLYMSFCNVEVSGKGINMIFSGLANYVRAFTVDIEFNRLLTEELGFMIINTLAIMVFSFFVALILNQKFKGRAFVRAVFFLPVILSSGVILGIEYDNALLASMAAHEIWLPICPACHFCGKGNLARHLHCLPNLPFEKFFSICETKCPCVPYYPYREIFLY